MNIAMHLVSKPSSTSTLVTSNKRLTLSGECQRAAIAVHVPLGSIRVLGQAQEVLVCQTPVREVHITGARKA